MPTYEYHCSRCKSTYELRQGFDAPTTHTCEECRKGKAKRVLHAPRVVFKGNGFYVTDSKKSTVSSTDSKDSKSESSTESKSESKSAAEPAGATSTGTTDSAAAD